MGSRHRKSFWSPAHLLVASKDKGAQLPLTPAQVHPNQACEVTQLPGETTAQTGSGAEKPAPTAKEHLAPCPGPGASTCAPVTQSALTERLLCAV